MTETTAEKKHITIGILAHVDAGKTTLSEELLYETGVRKQAGRVDNGDTLLDHDEMERSRGITIFSKQAELSTAETDITLLDTPGHVDFTAEMERTLQVLDYAILVISASDRIQAHTKTVWRLLNEYRIPVFLFVNKMDQPDNLQSLHIILPNNTPAAVPNANAIRPSNTIFNVLVFRNASALVDAPTDVPSRITTMYIIALEAVS